MTYGRPAAWETSEVAAGPVPGGGGAEAWGPTLDLSQRSPWDWLSTRAGGRGAGATRRAWARGQNEAAPFRAGAEASGLGDTNSQKGSSNILAGGAAGGERQR